VTTLSTIPAGFARSGTLKSLFTTGSGSAAVCDGVQVDSLLDYADRMWRGEAAMTGLLPGGAPLRQAAEVAPGVAVVLDFANTIAFRTGDGLVLFDTGLAISAPELAKAVRAWSSAPLRYAIYSHGHIDHVSGMGPYDAEAAQHGWPRPVVVAHESVGTRFDRYIRTAGYNAVINRRQFGLDELDWPREYRRPDLTYRDTMTLHAGEITVELHHALGETDDHTWAYVPEREVVCCGDLFIWVAPNAGNPQKVQRYPAEWAAALRSMAAKNAQVMLPSHGPPVVGAGRVRAALTDTADYLDDLIEQTLALMNSGARLDEVIHAVRPPARLAAKPYLRPAYDDPEFIVRTIWRRYGGWYDGNPAHLKPAREADLAAALAGLAGGARAIAGRARESAAAGDLRLASDLAELAALASPADEMVQAVRAQVYDARAAAEPSLMARGIYRWAARESRRATGSGMAADNGDVTGGQPA
jgi:glyoxylase-like metal-dependent hydrolase (beta-lactamase superfamily II)